MFMVIGDDVRKRNLPMAGIIILIINLIVYAYMTRLWFETKDHKQWLQFVESYSLKNKDLSRGDMLGLFTSQFLHFDLSHLLGNMLMLIAFMGTLEECVGGVQFALLYIMWGAIAGVADATLSGKADYSLLGASGAIAGVIGAYFTAFGARTRVKIVYFIYNTPRTTTIPATVFFVLWIVSQLTGMIADSEIQALQKKGAKVEDSHIAYVAHLSGFLSGAVSMLLMQGANRRLVRSADGELAVDYGAEEDPRPGTPEAAAKIAAANSLALPSSGPPKECPHCKTPFDDSCAIGKTLLRCKNANCSRLTMVT